MILIQCTKKLAGEFKDSLTPGPAGLQPIYGWHAHLFLYNRRKCVLVMNNISRYNFVMYGLTKDDFTHFDYCFTDELMRNLLADGVEPRWVEKYLEHADTFHFAPTSDRSIISQINEVVWVVKDLMQENLAKTGDPGVEGVNRFMNRYVFLKLPKLYSGETMKDMLGELFGG